MDIFLEISMKYYLAAIDFTGENNILYNDNILPSTKKWKPVYWHAVAFISLYLKAIFNSPPCEIERNFENRLKKKQKQKQKKNKKNCI